MKRLIEITLFLILTISSNYAQIYDPIKWKSELKIKSKTKGEIILKAKIDEGWHLYGMQLPQDGPKATLIQFDILEHAKKQGEIFSPSVLHVSHDDNFGMDLNWYQNEAIFIQSLIFEDSSKIKVAGHVEFMACNDMSCLPPQQWSFKLRGNQAEKLQDDTTMTVQTPLNQASKPHYWEPVLEELSSFGSENLNSPDTFWFVFFAGFLGGFLALFTPCVWPIIPMTVSFFMKRSETKSKGRRDAILYGVSIVLIYLVLGIIITSIFGASALNSLSTSAVFNILFFALLVVFAISFFGAFEITLPSSWVNTIDSKADSTAGFVSILFMAFTLALVSFSCTGPIIGTLLVEVASKGTFLAPIIGMFGFSLALAIPFSLFALFPSWLKSLPKSGGWLNKVKVVLAFLELALAFKFLSVADLAYGWHILDREVFLSIWIVIFVLLGIYLIGKIKFKHDDSENHTSVGQLFLAIVSFAFALYMIPGLWGAPLKAISAFTPPMTTQDFKIQVENELEPFTDFDQGMEYALSKNLPVIIDFSGYGCVNCRKMEASVWTDPEVKKLLSHNFVLISLYVDDKTPLENPFKVYENNKLSEIKTIGDKWSYLQRSKFGANAQPYYVMIDNQGKPLNRPFTFDENPTNFIKWLNKE
jgi:thiol:disulfide interchange protein DsbD